MRLKRPPKDRSGVVNEAAEPVGVAAFDFDGTLIKGDSLFPFLVRAVGPRQFGLDLMRASPATLNAYRLRGRDGSKAVLVARLLAGYPAERLAALGERYGAQLALRIRPQMVERVAWHRDRGHRLVIVSASFDSYLRSTGRTLGFDGVIATGLEVGPDGRLTGRLHGPNVRGTEKAVRLRQWLAGELHGGAYRLWAYGDSAGDEDLLAMADYPVKV